MTWNNDNTVCGNCRHWKLAHAATHTEKGRQPFGCGGNGNGIDGTRSDCLRRAPSHFGDSTCSPAIWPATKRLDTCGEFELRGATEARLSWTPAPKGSDLANAWDAINKHIKPGSPLDPEKLGQRNGLILAANIVAELAYKVRALEELT